VLAVVLALASAIGYGGSDFAAGLASRSAPVIQITLLASAVSALIVVAALPFAASPGPSATALAWGFAAGLGGTLGAFALYLGFRHAAFSVAAPLSAVAAAGFSVLAGLLYGERPTALALTGIVLALPAIVSVSVSAGGEEAEEAAAEEGAATGTHAGRPAAGVLLGLLAGVGFALLFIGLDRAGSGSGLWPVVAATAGEFAAALVAAVAVRSFALCGGRARLLAVITGVAGATGTILFFFATHQGFLAVTAVLTSLYPAVTIVLARAVLGERLTALRLGGLVTAGACVTLIALGGTS
jgi:drug/metabolite transporter (DMT)-like permease